MDYIIGDNFLSGNIPTELGRVRNLRKLNFCKFIFQFRLPLGLVVPYLFSSDTSQLFHFFVGNGTSFD